MCAHFEQHPLFKRLNEEETQKDELYNKLPDSSEEGKKVTRNKGDKFIAIHRRI